MAGDGSDLFKIIKHLPGMTDEKVRSKLLQNYSEGLWMNRRLTEVWGNDPSLPQLEMSEGAVFYLFVVYLTTLFC